MTPGTLRIGTYFVNPPFEYVSHGQRIGFEVDLMNEIAARLSLAAVFKSATAAMQELKASGTTRQTVAQFGPPGEGETVNDILGVPEVYELEERYDTRGEAGR